MLITWSIIPNVEHYVLENLRCFLAAVREVDALRVFVVIAEFCML